MKKWTIEEDKLIREKYPTFGSNKVAKLINRSSHSVVDRAYRLKVKFNRQEKKRTFCKECGIEMFSSVGIRNGIRKYYNCRNKKLICKKCSAKIRYEKREKFTNNYSKFWKENELNILLKEYSNKSNQELSNILKRSKYSISRKANRLKLKKSDEFWKNHHIITNKRFNSNDNPMHNEVYKKKAVEKIKLNWKEGKSKLSGIALKSSLGLTKKENHPNWLGGISFEPYDKNWDNNFKNSIRKRDNQICMLCKVHREKLKSSLCVHHINYDKKLSIKENCITLCNSCHMKTNYNRDNWIIFFQNILKDEYNYNYDERRIPIFSD